MGPEKLKRRREPGVKCDRLIASGRAALALSSTELMALIDGIDVTVRRRRKRYGGPRLASG